MYSYQPLILKIAKKIRIGAKHLLQGTVVSLSYFTAIASLVLMPMTSWAIDPNTLPTGGTVVSGQANISQSGNAVTVNQSTDKMIANWNTFNIGQNASVAFQQPGAASVALNRILDQNPSQIFGRLSANGQIFLINPAGVYFGPTAQVDVGGLVASSLNLTNENFLSGKYHFESSGIAGSIINQGQIRTASGGYVAFLSPKITNEGAITTPGGTTALAAGDKVSLDFTGDKLVTFTVDQGAVDALIENKGLIQAEGGAALLTAKAANELTQSVVNNDGVIEARGISTQGGRILLDAEGGQTTISGILDASSDSGQGGRVVVTGDKVLIQSGAHLSASGATGGGEVLVGGSWQNSDPTVRQALETVVEKGATLEANATVNGDGGTVVAWSDVTNPSSVTSVHGRFEAKGGPEGGDGGRVETSGYTLDILGASVDASSAQGEGGLWLIDPTDITMDNAYVNGVSGNTTLMDYSAFRTTSGWTSSSGFQSCGANGYGACMDASRRYVQFSGKENQTVSRTYSLTPGTQRVTLSATIYRNPNTATGNMELVFKNNAGQTISTVTSQTLYPGGSNAYNFALSNVWVPENAKQVTVVFRQIKPYSYYLNKPGNNGFTFSLPSLTAYGTSGGIVPTLNGGTSVTVQTADAGGASGNINVTASVNKTAGGDATLTLKAHNNITIQNDISISSTSNKLNTILWSDTDANGGGIVMNNGSSISTNGGHLWLGGGSVNTAWKGLTVGNDYAKGTADGDLQSRSGIALVSASLNSNGGEIYLAGQAYGTSAQTGYAVPGIYLSSATINGGAGDISLYGKADGATTSNFQGITTETSTIKNSGSINLMGDGERLGLNIVSSTIQSTSADIADKIYIKGTTTNTSTYGSSFNSSAVLSSAAPIEIESIGSSGFGLRAINGSYIGYKAATNVTSSSSNITLTTDKYTMDHETASYLQSSGSLTIKPYTAAATIGIGGGAGTLQLASSYFATNFVNGFAGITVGSATVGDITISGSTTYSDPLTLKTAGSIVLNAGAGLTGAAEQNASLVFWADSDATGGGTIWMQPGSSISSNGGNITLGGGLDIATGFAQGIDGVASYTHGVFLQGANINSAGGDVTIRGKGSQIGSANGDATGLGQLSVGINSWINAGENGDNSLNLDSGTGKIRLTGVAQQTNNANSTNSQAVIIQSGKITSASTAADAITVSGDASTTSNNGFAIGVDLRNTVQTTAGGGISITGTGGTTSDTGFSTAGILTDGAKILSNSGPITLTGTKGNGIGDADISDFTGSFIGQKAGSNVTSSTSNITINSNSLSLFADSRLAGAGTLTVQPRTAGTTIGIAGGDGALSLPTSYFATNFANGFANITVGNATAGNITVGSTALAYNDPLTFKTAGNITLNSNASLTGAAAGGDNIKSSLVLWSDADNSGQGTIALSAGSAINTNGGAIVMAGGLDDGGSNAGLSGLAAGDGIPDGYAKTTAVASSAGVLIGQPGGADSSVNLLSGGGDIVVRGQGRTNNNGLGITSQGTFKIDSGAGNITILGKSEAGHGVEFGFGATPNWAITSASTSAGAITIKGATASTTDGYAGLWLGNKNTGNILIQATGAGGGVTLQGESTSAANDAGLRITNAGATTQILAQSGPISITGYSAGSTNDFVSGGTLYLGNRKDATAINGVTPAVTGSSADITITADSLTLNNTSTTIASTGVLTVKPYTAGTTIGIGGGEGALQLPAAFFTTNLVDGFSSITVGNTAAGKITAGAITASDNLTLLSGSGGIEITGAVNDGTNTVTLNTTGSATDSGAGAIIADKLALLGTGASYTLDSTANNVATLAANTGSVNYLDSDALTIGSVNPDGITASGPINIATASGDLTISQNITTTSTSSAAIILNAGKDAAAGTAAGGNIIISGSPIITTGADGRTTFYTGSVGGSTGLTAFIGWGTGRFRYGSDESATNYTAPLGGGLYAIYREKPTFTIYPEAKTITYGDAITLVEKSDGSYQNGDTAAERSGSASWTIGGTFSASGIPSAGVHDISYNGGYTSSLGYGYENKAASTDELTVNKANLTMTANDSAKVLTEADPALTAKYSGFVNGETAAVLSDISVTRAAGEPAGNYAITPSATATEGNYTVVPVPGTFTIHGAETLLIRVAGNNKSYGSALPGFTATEAKYVTAGNDLRTLTLTPTGGNNYNFDDGLGTTGSFSLTTAAGSLSDVGNYSITVTNFNKLTGNNFTAQATQTGNLAVTPLALTGSIVAGSSTYSLALTPGAATFTNVVGGDALTAATTVNTAGNTSTSGYLKAGNYDGIQYVSALGGAKAGNYTYADVKGNYTVTPLALTSVAGYRTYDGTTDTSGADLATLDGKVAGDVLSLTGKGAVGTKAVGENKALTSLGTLALAGADAANYSLTGTTGTLTITLKALTSISGNRVYDRTTEASGAHLTTLNGKIDGDILSLTGKGAVETKIVGENKVLTSLGDLALAGADAANYRLNEDTPGTLTITPKALTISGITATNKVYDGNTTATVSATGAVYTDIIAGDILTVSTASGTFANKDVANGKTVTLASSYTGTDVTNYTITDQATTTADITPAPLTVTANDDKKTFNNLPYRGGNGVVYAGFVNDETPAVLGGTLDYGGTSQGAVQAGTYGIDPLGLTSNNYTIAFKNGVLTINTAVVVVDPVAEGSQSSTNSTGQQTGSNTGSAQTPSMGPGAGSSNVTAPPVLSPPTGGNVTLSTATFSAPVTINTTGQTMTLTVIGASASGTMTDVGSLPVFTQSGGAPPALQGNFLLQQSGSAVALTPTAPSGTGTIAPPTVSAAGERSAPFTLTMENGMTLQMTAAVTQGGVLVVSAPDAAGNIDVQQAILMGAQVAKQVLKVELSSLNSALFVRQ